DCIEDGPRDLQYDCRPLQHCIFMNDSSHAAPLAPDAARGIDGRGLVATVSAFIIWGLMPLYMKLLQTVPVLEITAHRMLWGCLCGFAWVAVRGEIPLVWRA